MKIKILSAPVEFVGIYERCDGVEYLSSLLFTHYENGFIHNEKGPAIVWLKNGIKEWYLSNKNYSSEERWKIEVEKLKKHRLHSK